MTASSVQFGFFSLFLHWNSTSVWFFKNKGSSSVLFPSLFFTINVPEFFDDPVYPYRKRLASSMQMVVSRL